LTIQTIQKRVNQLEKATGGSYNVFLLDAEGVIPDEFRPGFDRLILIQIVDVDGTKRPLHPNLIWRGDPYIKRRYFHVKTNVTGMQ